MRILLFSVGKPRDRALSALHDDYASRIRRLGAEYESRWVAEVRLTGRFSEAHVREREARAILADLSAGGRVIALDRSGRQVSSRQLAAKIERWATPRATLIVGGPFGLGTAVLERADERWSLSALTFPHEMVRVIVAEQIYRALTIARRVPYHH